jgi:serine/threonine protein kinase
MRQIHTNLIAHQDLKPSNVLLFGQEARVADFGCASRKGHVAPHDEFNVAGDKTYSPPEQLYGFRHPDFAVRRIGCDMYMLGNLAAFLFTGLNVTSQLFVHLPSQFHWRKWEGKYDEVLTYLMNAYYTVIDELKNEINQEIAPEIVPVIEELCNPDIFKRGIRKWNGHHSQYSLERYVSRIDYIRLNIERRLRRSRKVS